MSQRTQLIVFSSPVDGREDEYNDWYDNTHLAEFTALPGVVSGRRFQAAPIGPGAAASYAAIYELDGDPRDVLKAMNTAIKSGEMHMSSAIDSASVSMTALHPHGDPYPAS
ncbi:MAG TPA: hypothetical protein VG164_05025 [Trebonia sp.]|nr:hypothetical protein [Trebonia sp.]